MNLFSLELQNSQEFLTEFFSSILDKGKLVNAYCLLGDAKKDKLDFAKELAKVLNCSEKKDDYIKPCGTCTNCKWIEASTHPATPLFLEPKTESKKQIITVESVKNLQKELAKTSDYYRVVVIPEANYMTLNKHSANALLKVLEEPNANILFLLLAEDADLVMATIISRTQQVKLRSNPLVEYSEEAQKLYDDFAKQIYTDSRLDAMSIAEDLGTNDQKTLVEFLEILETNISESLGLADVNGLALARQIDVIEETKANLRSFVRPKTAIEQMLVKVSGL